MNPQRLMTVNGTLVTRTPSVTDPYGSDTYTESTTSVKCWYSSPSTDERDGQVFSSLTVYAPPDTPLDDLTAVELPSLGRWEVDGRPVAHVSPRTQVPTHVTIRVRKGA